MINWTPSDFFDDETREGILGGAKKLLREFLWSCDTRLVRNGDGKMATPVPRVYCVAFYEEPILARIRGCVCFGRIGVALRPPRCGGQPHTGSRGSAAGSSERTGSNQRGRSKAVSGRRTPPQSRGAGRAARKGRGRHL